MITGVHYISILFTMSLVSLAGLYSARHVRTASDFSVGGRRIGPALIGGSLIGSFIGGTSTVGTAQTAYQYGLSAIWFTLGGGLACLLMGLFLAGPLKRQEVDTVPQFLAAAFGDSVRPWVALYSSAGIFIQIAAQSLAAIPILTSLFPVSPQWAAAAFAAVLISYVVFGGFLSASQIGLLKMILVYSTLFVAGCISFKYLGGYRGIRETFPAVPWLSLFPGSFSKELASGISAVIGFISTQTYLQPVFAGKDARSARLGLFLAGLLIPLAGLAAVMIGLYMRAAHPGINPGSALPLFLVQYLNPWLGGVALATLLISLVLSGAALCLGVGTILAQDVYGRYRPGAGEGEMLLSSRVMVLIVGLLSFIFVLFNLNTLILKWAFLSMALRGVTVFAPMMAAVFAPARVKPPAGMAAIILAPLFTLLWAILLPKAADPLYIGIAVSVFILICGVRRGAGREDLGAGRGV
ncbi:MAG: sodium:solute symporter family protein [Pelotomaculum sp.]|uniref:Na+/proline symporter n=1 Tax=Pelotomaculum thermopropionicum (strain DSM 13744 / JCM 10971 / SI) TaxID=370438 RepID=A5CYA8_PELTS|nr:sodium:solute symporter family protein [Pelotomaculum sp.]BAF61032.1 Na+/proline symporter [Pelotomaculum thermopropionicum SI]